VERTKRRHSTVLWLVLLLLLILVVTSTILAVNGLFFVSDRSACTVVRLSLEVPEQAAAGASLFSGTLQSSTAPSDLAPAYPNDGSGVVVDEAGTVWQLETTIDLFSSDYDSENGTTVSGENGDKVVAPGTSGEYHFQIQNANSTILDYTLNGEAWFGEKDSEDAIIIPVEVRFLNDYEGTYLVGSEDGWESADSLNQLSESVALNARCYMPYTLQWRWQYESGDDAADTALGDLAENEDITLTLRLYFTAEQETAPVTPEPENPEPEEPELTETLDGSAGGPEDPEEELPTLDGNASGPVEPTDTPESAPQGDTNGTDTPSLTPGGIPYTGDTTHTGLWLAIAILALLLMLVIIVLTLRSKRKAKTETMEPRTK
jgi:hypothetical protein